MRDLTLSALTVAPRSVPKGLAFEIADLILTSGWAAFHDVPMAVCLDHGAEDEEYEEVIAFRTEKSPLCRLIIWRNADAVFIQPLLGKTQRHGSVAEALESLLVKPPVVLTDIVAAAWPADARPA
jgi:hypothetical protein